MNPRPGLLAAVALCLSLTGLRAHGETSPGGEQSQAMLAKVFPSVVKIEVIRAVPNGGRMTKAEVGGSGVILSAEGDILTNFHVTENGVYFRCYLTDGSKVDAHRVGEDALTDLAVLRLDRDPKATAPLPVAPFGDSDRLVAGDTVYALGSPGFLTQSVTRGIVSNPSLVPPEGGQPTMRGEPVGLVVRWVFHDARIFFGNSGGPLVDSQGEVVGINEISVANLAGAIPGNLARAVASQLIASGHVTRGWSGISVQPRLEAAGEGRGVLVADVAPGSPADAAGVRPGDMILSADGHPIEEAEEKAVAHYYRLEMGRLPGEALALDLSRDGVPRQARIVLGRRDPPLADDVELRSWGAVVRNVTPELAREAHLPDTRGVWLESIQASGPCGQSEPVLRSGDVVIAVNRAPVADAAALRAASESLLANSPRGVRTILASIRRGGEELDAVLTLRTTVPHEITPEVRKAWLGVASQPLTIRLARRMGIATPGGVRLTRVYQGTQAEAAGLRIGDVLVAIDGDPIPARRPEDGDVLYNLVRQYPIGTRVQVSLWRAGARLQVAVTLEKQPVPPEEMPWWEDDKLEFSARDPAFADRMRLQLDPATQGALIDTVDQAGWASLAGLQSDDLVIQADGHPIASLADLRRSRADAAAAKRKWWVLLVTSHNRTHFVEIALEPLHHENSP